MPLPTPQRSDPINQTSWDSGMITSLPPEELPEDAAALIENFEFDRLGNLKSRFGVRAVLNGSLQSDQTETITSIFIPRFVGGTSPILFTAGNDLFNLTGNSSATNLTGAFTFPDGNRWYWVMFDEFAIGIHGSSTERPIKVNSAVTVTTLNANAPFAGHGVVWNNRLWLSGVGSNQNTIFGSAINDPEDWTTTGDAGAITLGIDIGDGDKIYALSVFRGDLYVYKRDKIYVVSAISAPATLPANLRVDVYAPNLGCIYPATIQNVIDDQLFVSAAGVTSLSLAPLGNIEGAVVSNNIAELGKLKRIFDPVSVASGFSPVAHNLKQKQQYLLAIPSQMGNGTNTAWVLDYSDIAQKNEFGLPKVRWCKFTGDVYGTAYFTNLDNSDVYLIASVPPGGGGETVISAYNPNHPDELYSQTATATTKRLITRAFGNSKKRSLWYRFGVGFLKVTTTVAFDVKWYFENYLTTQAGSYSHSSDGAIANLHRTYWRGFKKSDSGRKANLVQLEIFANTASQGFVIKSIELEHTKLNHRRSQTAFVSD